MINATLTKPVVFPCGTIYNLTIDDSTTVMEAWCCGFAQVNDYDDRASTLPHNFTGISCGSSDFLNIENDTTLLEGYLCGIGALHTTQTSGLLTTTTSAQKNGAGKLRLNWIHFLTLFGVLLHFLN
ncbi:LANO_0A05028g1_1 [Lachancea nothofagi CBS 11611]|uniref:LANO_0A05028g1_1 n=1 Tax=Lachancea nothofagi CBS 11611 TaxID=1266666 RepID=A0A1G4IR49_9SACH|nr:LANO_0A05028g1_1 [Lachancea nothofagi CBS 11611]